MITPNGSPEKTVRLFSGKNGSEPEHERMDGHERRESWQKY
jgi:hypothetical protein